MNNHGLIRSHQGSFSFGYRLLDILLISSLFLLCTSLYGLAFSAPYFTVLLVALLAYILLAESIGVYRSWRASTTVRMLMTAALSWSITCVLLLMVAFFSKSSADFSRLVVGAWMLSSLLALLMWRMGFRQLLKAMRKRGYNTRRAAIVGLNHSALRTRDELLKHADLGIRFEGFFDDRATTRIHKEFPDEVLSGCIEDLLNKTKSGEFDLIFVALPLKAQKRISDILLRCGDTTASVHLIPDFFTFNLLNARMGRVGNVQTLSVYETPLFGINDALKRLFDVVFSSLVLMLIALPMLVIAFMVKLTSKGPVIFKQYRYGLDGRQIKVWKFRSMTTQDNGSKIKQATKGDARITPVGAFIRKTSLDELPQFINVLQGRMSVVGPRPHAVAHNEEYRKLIPYYMLRHKMKPGITGWAQINGYRGETDTLDKMEGRIEHDLKYIDNWSIWVDIKIILLTVFKGFLDKNAH